MRKIIVLAVIVAAVVTGATALVSCGKEKPVQMTVAGTGERPGWMENADKPIQFDWYVNINWFNRQWGSSRVSRYITAKTGVDIRFIAPVGNESERLNAMIAGDALPDFITLGFWEVQIPLMINSEMVEPLNKLAEQYDPYFFKVANPERLKWYTEDNGNVYRYPNGSFTTLDLERNAGKLDSHDTFLVRKDMYEALGSPDMTTPEGFLNALRAARDRFPVIDGQPINPLGFHPFNNNGNFSLETYLAGFLAIPRETQDGRFEAPNLGMENPEYVRWIKVFRQAVSEGLISMEAFVDDEPQIQEKVAQGRYFAILYESWYLEASLNARYNIDPNTLYIAIDGPKNSNGDPHRLATGGISGWTLTLISKNCKDKARAIQFMTYLLSDEGQMDTFFGVPENNPYGIEPTYTVVNGVPALLPYINEMDKQDKNRQETEIGAQYTYWMLMDSPWQYQFPMEYTPTQVQPKEWTRQYVTTYGLYSMLDIEPDSDEGLILQDIQLRWGQDLPRLLLANTDEEFDRIWADFQKFKLDRGYSQLQAKYTELLNRNKAKLGM